MGPYGPGAGRVDRGDNAVFDFQEGKAAWGLWWGFVAAVALFAAIFAAPMTKKDS